MRKTKTKSKTISFAEMRHLLQELGYKEKCADNAHVFHRAKKDLVVFRRYEDREAVDISDILNTRLFLDMRGILDEAEFDSFFASVNKSA